MPMPWTMRGVAATTGDVDGRQQRCWARIAAQVASGNRQQPSLAQLGQARGVMVDRSKAAAASGRKRQGALSGQGASELALPGQALGEMQGEATGLAGDASDQGERERRHLREHAVRQSLRFVGRGGIPKHVDYPSNALPYDHAHDDA